VSPAIHDASPLAVRDGLATLGPALMRLAELLDACFLRWATRAGAASVQYPPLIAVADLAAMDYFQNFPHLGMLVSAIDPDEIPGHYQQGAGRNLAQVPRAHLCDSGYALPSAACYNVYAGLNGATLAGTHRVTTLGTCFRNESHYDGLRRLRSFRMREIVVVGPAADCQQHLSDRKADVLALTRALGIEVRVAAATDPFFDAGGARAQMQRLFPVKEEIVFGGDLAIASLNYHRNFFGERFGIRLAGGEPAHSACVGMGMERWIHALTVTYEGDAEQAAKVLQEVLRS
jgi:seryl-tRNA synthetase